MLRDGSWKDVKFKEYNYNAMGKDIVSGNLHPLLKIRH
jgi:phenylalanyl-tRNA synthetase alpha chain